MGIARGALLHQIKHSLLQGLRPRQRWLCRLRPEDAGRQQACRLGFNGPVRDQQTAGTGEEEPAPETGHRLTLRAIRGAGVAGRKHDPVGIQAQAENFIEGQQAVILGIVGQFRIGQRQRLPVRIEPRA